jgi:hypothetical protein
MDKKHISFFPCGDCDHDFTECRKANFCRYYEVEIKPKEEPKTPVLPNCS